MRNNLIFKLFSLASIFLITSCNSDQPVNKVKQEDIADTNSNDTVTLDTIEEKAEIIPVFGYRFIIEGDFNGDGKSEKLYERFYSSTEGKETNKFYQGLSYDSLVSLTVAKDPITFLSCDDPDIDSFFIASEGQLLGLSYLKNEGDLNGDGTDEISYVISWADWSNLNSSRIATFRNGKWEEIYAFGIWDWQLPDLPETFNDYGLFGLESKYIESGNDSINEILEKQLLEFPGFIKKINSKQFEVYCRNEEAMEDTVLVDGSKL